MTDERRRSPRIDVDLAVEFDYLAEQHEHLEGRTINLSAGGARLDLGHTLDQDERGVLLLEARDQFIAIAVIAQPPTDDDRRDGATRVQFWRMSDRARATLGTVIADLTDHT